MKRFRAAQEGELPVLWQAPVGKAIFPDFEAMKNFYHTNPALIQVSVDPLSCIGIMGNWRAHLPIGAIKAFVAPPAYKRQFLGHLISVLRKEGFGEVLSPPLEFDQMSDFYEAGFKDCEHIIILKGTGFSKLPKSSDVLQVSEFDASHLSSLVQIEREAFSDFWRLGQDELAHVIEEGTCFVAFFKGAAVGYNINTVKEANGTVARLAILPQFQGRGFGSQLLASALRWFEAMKVTSVLIATQVYNKAAQQLYAKYGFEIFGNRHILLFQGGDKQ